MNKNIKLKRKIQEKKNFALEKNIKSKFITFYLNLFQILFRKFEIQIIKLWLISMKNKARKFFYFEEKIFLKNKLNYKYKGRFGIYLRHFLLIFRFDIVMNNISEPNMCGYLIWKKKRRNIWKH